jgi:tellurite resistance protein
MKTRWTWASLFGLAAVAAAVMISTAASQQQPTPRKSVFSSLKAGQPVTVKDKGQSVEISTMEGDTLGTHTVVEIGDDYIVLRDVAGVTESRVPIYAIRGIVHIKTKPK